MKNRILRFASEGSFREVSVRLNPSIQKDLQYVVNSLHIIALLKKTPTHHNRNTLNL